MRRGFSLIETMLGSTILCLCMGCILVFLPTSFLSLKDSERRIYAGNLAQQVLEQHRNFPLESLDELGSQPRIVQEVDYESIRFTVFLEVRRHPRANYARTLKVTVDWIQHQRLQTVAREAIECRVRR